MSSVGKKILGESPAVRALTALIERVAGSKTNVLIIGESGTGKELVARMIHDSGPLRGKPFIPVNCGAIPETLIESEMFGHRKGSFTGAVGEKMGLFEAANGGTLFLDEVGELPLSMQVKLLRAIQERVVRKVGGTDDIRIDVRIIAATNRDLEAGVAKGTFREDLYYRLNVLLIKTPPLRERRGDIRLLADVFLKRYAEKQGKPVMRFSPEAIAALESFPWPGNIRELENIVERAVTLENGAEVSFQSLPANVISAAAGAGGAPRILGATGGRELQVPAPDFAGGPLQLDAILGDVEKAYLLAALESAGGVKKKAADLLGITFRSMRYRLKKLGLDDDGPDEVEGEA